jgi:hypothetical protein
MGGFLMGILKSALMNMVTSKMSGGGGGGGQQQSQQSPLLNLYQTSVGQDPNAQLISDRQMMDTLRRLNIGRRF